MRKLIKKRSNVRKGAILTRIVVTVVIMAICLAAMSYTAYAYYSRNIISKQNIIKAADFKTSIQIKDSNGNSVVPVKVDEYTHTAELTAGTTYTVTITRTGNTATGFCVISAKKCEIEKYHTQQLYLEADPSKEMADTVTFELEVTDTTEVTFYAHWGTSSNYPEYVDKGTDNELYITNDSIGAKKIVMQIDNTSQSILLALTKQAKQS